MEHLGRGRPDAHHPGGWPGGRHRVLEGRHGVSSTRPTGHGATRRNGRPTDVIRDSSTHATSGSWAAGKHRGPTGWSVDDRPDVRRRPAVASRWQSSSGMGCGPRHRPRPCPRTDYGPGPRAHGLVIPRRRCYRRWSRRLAGPEILPEVPSTSPRRSSSLAVVRTIHAHFSTVFHSHCFDVVLGIDRRCPYLAGHERFQVVGHRWGPWPPCRSWGAPPIWGLRTTLG